LPTRPVIARDWSVQAGPQEWDATKEEVIDSLVPAATSRPPH
jgi:hypothetical protein